MGTLQTTVGADSRVKATIMSRASVTLRDRASVSGAVTTEGALTRQTGATVAGGINEHQPIGSTSSSWSVTFPTSTSNVLLEPSRTATIAPGAYAHVSVKSGATLTLATPGTYFFDDLTLEPQGRVLLGGDGSFLVYVRAALSLKGSFVPGGPSSTLMLAYAGSTNAFVAAPFRGVLIAPNATVTLADIGTQSHLGAFFSKSLDVQAPVRIQHVPSMLGPTEPLAPPPAGGDFRCAVYGQSALAFGPSHTSTVTGSMLFTFRPAGALTADVVTAHGSPLCVDGTCSAVDIRPDPSGNSMGTYSVADGAVRFTLPALVRFPDLSNTETQVPFSFQGRLQHRTFVGTATATLPSGAPMFAGTAAQLSFFCGQEEPHQVVDVTIGVDASGALAPGVTLIREGSRPSTPRIGSGFAVDAVDESGVTIATIPFSDPRVGFDAPPLASASVALQLPFANGVRSMIVRDLVRMTSIRIDLTSAITSFCQTSPTNPECRRAAAPGEYQPTTFALSSSAPAPGLTTARATGAEVHVAFPAGAQGSAPNDRYPAVAALPTGETAVTWYRDLAQSKDIRMRIFNSAGVPIGNDFGLVAAGNIGIGVSRVTAGAGLFAAVWVEVSSTTLLGSIVFQKFDSAGRSVGDRITVATEEEGKATLLPEVAIDGKGRVIVSWIELETSSSSATQRLRAQRFKADNSLDGGQIGVTDLATGRLALGADNAGRFVIAYTEATSGGPTTRVQRFNDDRGKAGSPIVLVKERQELGLAVAPDSGDFVVVRSDGTHVFGARYSSDGQVIGSGRLDGLDSGRKTSPRVAAVAANESIATWTTTTVSQNQSVVRVTGQVFDRNLVPLDIDFDVGSSRVPSPPIGDQGAAPEPRAAAMSDRYAVVWEAPGGVRLQTFRPGSYSCPARTNCGAAIPLMINGDSENTFDVVLVRGVNSPIEKIGNLVLPDAFVRDEVVRRIINDVFVVGDIERHRKKFNVYYVLDAAAPGVTDADATIRATYIGTANETTPDRTRSIISVGPEADASGNFRHEGGHAIFYLGDEYPCNTSEGRKTLRAQPPIHGNIFPDLARCTSLSVNPSACRILDGAPQDCYPQGNWATSDPADDVMWSATGTYGPDCLAQREAMMEHMPCAGQGSVSCR